MTETIRDATPEDAADLVRFVLLAGEGLPDLAWAEMAEPGQAARDVGLMRARRTEGAFSYVNARVFEAGGKVIAGLVGYRLPDPPVDIGPDFPAQFVPLQELENLAPGYWYVNILGVNEDAQSKGYGSRLLADAESRARDLGCPGMAIIAFASNPGAMRLYLRSGYFEKDRRHVVIEGWAHSGTDAVLLVKSF